MQQTLANPFALTPGSTGQQPSGLEIADDSGGGAWSRFMMAMINTKAVHRSNHLLGQLKGGLRL